MRNVRVMNIPVGVLLAWILVLGYVLWAVETVGPRMGAKRSLCAAPVVEMASPLSPANNS